MDYYLWGISWRNVQKMLIDAPSYDYDDKSSGKKKGKPTKSNQKLNSGNAGDIANNFFNSIPR